MSGANSDDAGIRTATDPTMPCRTVGRAIGSPLAAPSAEMHGMAAVQAPDAGAEHGDLSVETPSSVVGYDVGAADSVSPVFPSMPGMSGMDRDASALTAAAIRCIPGTTHTTPSAVIVR